MNRIKFGVISLFYYLIIINVALIDLPRLGFYLFIALMYPAFTSVVLKEGPMEFRIVFFFLSLMVAVIAWLFGPFIIIQGGF